MQYTDYVAGWAVVIQSLDPAWGWAVVSRAWIPSQLRAWVAWQWLSRAWILPRCAVLVCWAVVSRAWIPSQRHPFGGCGAVVIQSLDPASGWAVVSRAWIPSQRRTWGLGSGYPEPWILPRGVCLGGWAVVSRALDPVAAAPSVSLAVVIQSLDPASLGRTWRR